MESVNRGGGGVNYHYACQVAVFGNGSGGVVVMPNGIDWMEVVDRLRKSCQRWMKNTGVCG
jgi:hypothetical protein